MKLLKIALQDSGRVAASASLNAPAAAAGAAGAAAQAPPVKVKAPTATEIAMKVFKQKGFLGFYQGGTATLVRDVFFSAVYFPLFAYFNSLVSLVFFRLYFEGTLTVKSVLLKGKVDPETNKTPFYHTFGSGIAAGSLGAYIATPLDGEHRNGIESFLNEFSNL